MSELRSLTRQEIEFSAAVREKMAAVAYKLKQENYLPFAAIPQHLRDDYSRTRLFHKRTLIGIFKASPDELASQQRIARWCIETWHKLHGTTPPGNQWSS